MNKKGFTLVELLLVIVIMGIITALTMPSFIESITESKLQKEKHLEFLIKQKLDLLNKDVGEEDFWCGTKCGSTSDELILNDESNEYNKAIRKDIDMKGCKIDNIIVKKDGDHIVEVTCY